MAHCLPDRTIIVGTKYSHHIEMHASKATFNIFKDTLFQIP